MKATEAYDRLLHHSKETALYDSMRSLLGWDQRTYLPRGGNIHRTEQIAAITGLINIREIDPQRGEMLKIIENSELVADPLSDEAVNTREWRRLYDRTCKIPRALVIELARATSEGETAWETCRGRNDWKSFLPYLKRIVSLKRQEATTLAMGDEAYDGLINDFEPGERSADIQLLFGRLAQGLRELLHKIHNSGKRPRPGILQGNSPIHAQKNFIGALIERLGFDSLTGRIDRSAHPFTSGIGPGDVRITTRFDTNSFIGALLSAVHETGHALYEHGLPREHWGTPRGTTVSMAVHESQSLMWENIVTRSDGFWKYFYPSARKHFPWLAEVEQDQFVFALNEVFPSLIRTEADEVTYNLHIILRFELERALIRGELEVEDLPKEWENKMEEYLGIKPPDYSSGVMQDIHWSGGAIGYFPSYALGTLYAAQFYAKAEKDLGNLEEIFETGDFSTFLAWFRKKIHSQGSRYVPHELAKQVTGEDLNPDYLLSYLNRKHGRLYGFV